MDWIPMVAALVIVVAAVPLVTVTDLGRKAADLRVKRLERRLELIMAHLGIQEPEPDVPPGVMHELAAGRKIQAIKAYRKATGVGLKDAKDAVDALARRHLGA